MVSRSHAIVNGHFTGVSKVSLDCEGYRLTPFDLESVEITKETREVERHGAYIYTIKYSLHRLWGAIPAEGVSSDGDYLLSLPEL